MLRVCRQSCLTFSSAGGNSLRISSSPLACISPCLECAIFSKSPRVRLLSSTPLWPRSRQALKLYLPGRAGINPKKSCTRMIPIRTGMCAQPSAAPEWPTTPSSRSGVSLLTVRCLRRVNAARGLNILYLVGCGDSKAHVLSQAGDQFNLLENPPADDLPS